MDYNRDKESIKLLVDIASHLSRFVHIAVQFTQWMYENEKKREAKKKNEKKNVYRHTTMNL